jgi:hypothetical protein
LNKKYFIIFSVVMAPQSGAQKSNKRKREEKLIASQRGSLDKFSKLHELKEAFQS